MSLEIYGDGTVKKNGNTALSINNTPQVSFENSVSQPGSFMFRNKIINGGFDIWQRGTSQTSATYGSADRWLCFNSGSTKTASRQLFTVGQTDVPGNPIYFMRHVVTSSAGASNQVSLQQKIESVQTLAGKPATLSFWAKADSSKQIAVNLQQNFGTGGTPSSSVTDALVQKIQLTSSWQKFTLSITIPSISGKTLGSDLNDFLFLLFWFDAGSNFNDRTDSLGQQSGTFDIAQVQLEEGSAATPFEERNIVLEFDLCKRYYYKIASDSTGRRYDTGYIASTTTAIISFTHLSFRSIPTVSFNDMTIQSNSTFTVTSLTSVAYPISSGRFYGVYVTFNFTGSATTGYAAQLRSSTASSYLDFDAEL